MARKETAQGCRANTCDTQGHRTKCPVCVSTTGVSRLLRPEAGTWGLPGEAGSGCAKGLAASLLFIPHVPGAAVLGALASSRSGDNFEFTGTLSGENHS